LQKNKNRICKALIFHRPCAKKNTPLKHQMEQQSSSDVSAAWRAGTKGSFR
jgi:hypothetical protein